MKSSTQFLGFCAGTVFCFGLALVSAASATEYKFGETTLSLDTTVSLGIGIRTHGQDCSHINTVNGAQKQGCASPIGVKANVNTDDGDVNYAQWDVYSARAKFVTDLEAKRENYGAFVRLKGFYDYAGDRYNGQTDTPFGKRPLEDPVRGNDAHNAAAWDLSLLDAFVYGNFNVAGGNALNVRFGKQVVNWGESLAIAGGINQFQPVDLSALRTPGAEIKEALLPEEILYASLSLPYDMNIEGWAGFHWRSVELDPVGTFFSTIDFYGPGGNYINLAADDAPNSTQLTKGPDKEPGDFGSIGVKYGYYANWLNDGTELGLYFVRYNSILPILEFQNSLPVGYGGTGELYRMTYPKGTELFGASFATTLSDFLNGTAFSGEIVYQPNLPFQLSTAETFLAREVLGAGGTSSAASSLPFDQTSGAYPLGYIEQNAISGQLATISTFPTSEPLTEAFGADLVVFVANWGFQWLPDINQTELNALAVSRSETQVPNVAFRGIGTVASQPLLHADSFSHGLRLIASAQYNNAFGTPVTLTPSIQFGWDFKSSAGPVGPGFLDNRKSLSLGVRGTYQKAWSAGVQWTATRGNTFQNLMDDRDFMTADVSYAF